MAQYAVKGFVPGIHSVFNGRPTMTDDPDAIDKYTTWLASGRKPAIPCVITEPLDSSVTHTLSVPVPPYTAHVAVGFLCHGAGSIEVTCSSDTYNSETGDIAIGPGTTGTHSLDDAQWVWLDEPYAAVAGDGLLRALDVTVASSSSKVTMSWTITDKSGTESLLVYGVMAFWLAPDDTTTLP